MIIKAMLDLSTDPIFMFLNAQLNSAKKRLMKIKYILIIALFHFISCSKSNEINSDNESLIENVDPNPNPKPEPEHNPDVFDSMSSIITNDRWWKDDNGNDILASYGGHITKFGDRYYWVGNNQNASIHGGDIHMYSSSSLGSNSWKHEGKMVDFESNRGGKNCTLIHSPHTGKFVIVAKGGFVFYESSQITGPYIHVRTILKNQVGERINYKIGGMGTFQDGDNAYIITSRRWLGEASSTKPLNHRYTGIYKLTPDFLDIEEEVSWLRNDAREAMWLFKKNNTYYMTASHTAGWTASNCYYRTSTNLVDWSDEKEIGMNPHRPGGTQADKIMRSHGSQQRWIMKIGDKWVFAGDRYPYEEPESHPFEKGLYVWCPVVWEGNHPIVNFEESWSVE